MLKFWKKSSQKEKSSDSGGTSPSSTPWGVSPTSSTGYLTADLAAEIEEIEKSPIDKQTIRNFSRLSKPLVHLLNDSEALGYFFQYLDTLNATTLVKCVMDIDHYAACFNDESEVVDWTNVKGVNLVACESGKKRWDFCNGVGYTSPLACDISKKCETHVKAGVSDCGCERTTILAPSQAKLSEMEIIETNCLTELLQTDSVSVATLDALRIFYKYFSFKAPYKIILDVTMFRALVEQLRRNISSKSFSFVYDVIFVVLDKEFYNDFLRSEFHCKYQMTVLTGSQVEIADIIYNEAALFYFTEFLEQEGHRGVLEFWIAANHFRELHQTSSSPYDPVQAQTDAMVLYDKYFSLQATHPLHLGDKLRFQVEESICQESGPLPTCFEPVQNLIVRLLQVKFLSPFLQSQLYFNFLSELISTASAGPASRGGGSDCSSEVSISVTNTLLASDDSMHRRRLFRNWDSGSLNIDSRQLYDPDALWRRGKQAGLAFGRVNSLGRFETDLEPEPDRKQGLESRITKAMKRLVNREEDKSKEEMAWQVAEMIVKDVTSLTMPSTNP